MSRLAALRAGSIVLLVSLLPYSPASAQLSTTGQWTGNFEFKDPTQSTGNIEVAIHLVVLRGRADSTHVFYFTHGDQTRLVLDAMAGATAPHVNIPYLDKCANDYFESFCSGHSTLADGRLFIAGGEVNIAGQAPSGSKFAGLFNPRDYGSASRGWTLPDAMVDGRYYPTCTTMPDGTVLVTQGDQHFEMLTYGGYNTSDSAQNDARTYAITAASPFWRGETVRSSLGATQVERVGHSANHFSGLGGVVALFGGKNAQGQLLQHLHFIYRRDTTDVISVWDLYQQDPVPGSAQPPSSRWFHAAAGAPGGTEIIFHGGQGANNAILGDLHRLQGVSGDHYRWTAPISGPARWRHTAVYDPGPPADSARILIFGGRETTSALADNSVRALRLKTLDWYVAVGSNSDTTEAPAARERHGAFFRSLPGVSGPMLVFGGLDESNALLNDAWVLERPATNFDYEWRKLDVGNRPQARSDFSMSYDPQRHIIVVAGGDANGEEPEGQLADVWGLPLDLCSTGGNPDWYALPGMGSLGARSGHASAFSEVRPVSNRIIGRFAPAAAPGQQWKLLHWAPKVMPLTYPFMFVLPNGHVAWTGPNGAPWGAETSLSVNQTMVLNPDSTSATKGWQGTTWSNQGAWGGSAVMYMVAPDSVRIMKCGAHHGRPEEDSTHTFVIAFSATGGTEGWARVAESSGALFDRRDHNLIILPTGEVLVTGGRNRGERSKVQIWNPDTRLWSEQLAEDTRIRNYHSSAALLPDGRVLSVGGHDDPPVDKGDRTYATIYEPPYLFDGNGPSTRPQISSALARATYAQTITICVNDAQAIDRVTLLRPAATTHAFDQNQRFLSLAFARASDPSRLFVTMPYGPNLAPPGDYLLFVCDSTGGRSIPSIGRWINLYAASGRDSCDVVRPAGGNYLSLQTEGCVPPSYGDVRLRWTSPGDDTALVESGAVKDYDLRYVLNSGSPPPFESWTAWPTMVTQLAGGSEQVVIGGLPNAWHRFALRPNDDNQNVAVLSNQVVARPLWCEDDFSGGSGGGGGSLVGEVAAVASIEGMSPVEASAFRENSLLHGLALGERGRDLVRLAAPPVELGGAWSVVLRQSGQGAVNLGHVRLLLADHAEGTDVVAGPASLLSGTLLPATRVLDGESRDRTAAARGEAPDPVYANAGEVLDVELPEGDVLVLVLEAEASDDPATTGILIEVPSGSGSWSPVAKLHPRRNADRVAFEDIPARSIRLRSLGAHALSYVGRLSGATRLTAVEAVLSGSRSAGQGDVLAALLADDPVTLSLEGADSVRLSFVASPTPPGMVRDYFLEVEGARVGKSGSRSARLAGAETPARVDLLPSLPNPAQATSRLRFALPEPAWITLDIHDAQGRLVKRHAGAYDAGLHAVEWDLRDLVGRRVAPGIYIQRLSVGGSRMERTVVVLR